MELRVDGYSGGQLGNGLELESTPNRWFYQNFPDFLTEIEL